MAASIGPRGHLRWLAQQKFDHPAQQIVFQDAVDTIEDAATRLRRLDEQVAAIVPSWSMAPVVEAYQAMREVGRRATPSRPGSERSSGWKWGQFHQPMAYGLT
jgi:hypothetical protein